MAAYTRFVAALGAVCALASGCNCSRVADHAAPDATRPSAPVEAVRSPAAAEREGMTGAPVPSRPWAERAEAPPAPAPPDAAAPSVPGPVVAEAVGDRRVALRWGAATDDVGVSAYEVLRDGAVLFAGPGLETEETALEPARRYCYSVRALDAAGHVSAESGPSCATTPDLAGPTAPGDLAVEATSESDLEIRWAASADDVAVVAYDVEREGQIAVRTEVTRLALHGLGPGTRHCVTVRARDGAGNRSPPAGPACATTLDVTPPSTPGAARALARTETSIEVAWKPSADNVGVAGYEVTRDGALDQRVAVASATSTGLRAVTRYCYAVRAYDGAGNRSEATAPVCATTPDQTPPTPPRRLEAVAAGEGRIRLRWDPSMDEVGVAGYELRRDGEALPDAPAPHAADGGLRAWSEHCYTVRAFDRAGNRSEAAGPVCARTRDATPPSVPARVRAAAAAPDRIDLAWEASTDDGVLAGYEVRRELRVVATVAAPPASEAGLGPGRSYCYAVRALDAAGNRSAESTPACTTVPDVTAPTVPGELAAEALSETEIGLRWSASTDDHRVERYEVASGGRVVARTATAGAAVGGQRAAVEACFTVRAVDPSGNRSADSAPACATPPDRTPPSTPADVAAAAASDTEVRLRWRASKDEVGVAGYEVFRDGTPLREQRETQFADAGLRVATRYCYEARAFDAAGNRSPRSAAACVTTPDLKPPAAPARIQAVAGARMAIGWSEATDDVGVVAYEVLRAGGVVARVQGTDFVEVGLAPGRWCYTVRALDAAGNRSPEAGPACAVAPDVMPPSPPSRLRASRVAETHAELRWSESTDNVGVEGYEVLRASSVVITAPAAAARDAGLAPAREYCWTVRAFDASGNRSAESERLCLTTPDETPPTLRAPLAASADAEDLVVLGWPDATDNVGVVGYEIERDGAPLATVAEPRFRDAGRTAWTRYCYTVRARDAAGLPSGALSGCVTTPDTTPPGSPSDLEAAPTATEVALRWTEAGDNVRVTAYEVLRGGAVVQRVPGAVAVEKGLSARTRHCFSVRALDAAGNRSRAVEPLCTETLDPAQPPAPRNLAAAAAPTGVDLAWSASPRKNVVYRIYADGRSIGATRYLAFPVTAAAARAARCFRVSAVDDAGQESPRSNEACVASAGFAPSAQ